jgi:hypothetical protein
MKVVIVGPVAPSGEPLGHEPYIRPLILVTFVAKRQLNQRNQSANGHTILFSDYHACHSCLREASRIEIDNRDGQFLCLNGGPCEKRGLTLCFITFQFEQIST